MASFTFWYWFIFTLLISPVILCGTCEIYKQFKGTDGWR